MSRTMTIEEVAEAIGNPYAHLAPFQTNDQPNGPGTDLVPTVWWAVWTWDEDELRRTVLSPVLWTDEHDDEHYLAGPTREAALIEATAVIMAGHFDPHEECPHCHGRGSRPISRKAVKP